MGGSDAIRDFSVGGGGGASKEGEEQVMLKSAPNEPRASLSGCHLGFPRLIFGSAGLSEL